MDGIFVPIALSVAALLAAIATYRGIRRGGARFYTLEREAILRNASRTLFASMLFFAAAIGLLLFQRQQLVAVDEVVVEENGTVVDEGISPTATLGINAIPPTISPTPTVDVNIPTATPEPVICRGVVEGTFDNGLTLRTEPGGAEVDVLPEATIITILVEEVPVEANGFIWRKVRSLFGDEGWVAEDFITLGTGCE
ncbi:MAG: SH3 domain-containing protein [Chloroflexi bacterium]|nr:SH3 domain-containing protein [Chloroflexota bacterium]